MLPTSLYRCADAVPETGNATRSSVAEAPSG